MAIRKRKTKSETPATVAPDAAEADSTAATAAGTPDPAPEAAEQPAPVRRPILDHDDEW